MELSGARPPGVGGTTEIWFESEAKLAWSCGALLADVGSGAGAVSSNDVFAEGVPNNGSRSRASGTGLTMKRLPAECTTCAAKLGGIPGTLDVKISGTCWLELLIT